MMVNTAMKLLITKMMMQIIIKIVLTLSKIMITMITKMEFRI